MIPYTLLSAWYCTNAVTALLKLQWVVCYEKVGSYFSKVNFHLFDMSFFPFTLAFMPSFIPSFMRLDLVPLVSTIVEADYKSFCKWACSPEMGHVLLRFSFSAFHFLLFCLFSNNKTKQSNWYYAPLKLAEWLIFQFKVKYLPKMQWFLFAKMVKTMLRPPGIEQGCYFLPLLNNNY